MATPVQLDDPAALGEFLGVIGTGWALVIIDPLLRHTAGDTNSQRDASAFIDACATVGHATGAAVLIVHHSGKDQSRGAMGSTAYEAAVDGAATLTGEGDGPRTLQITLMRDTSANQPPLVFELVRVEAEPTFEDGEPPPIASAAFRLVASADKAKAGQSALDRLLVAAHASDNPTGESLAATLGVRFTALSRPAKRARELGYMGGNDYRLTTKGREFVVTLS